VNFGWMKKRASSWKKWGSSIKVWLVVFMSLKGLLDMVCQNFGLYFSQNWMLPRLKVVNEYDEKMF
jgi:hypothetical protein